MEETDEDLKEASCSENQEHESRSSSQGDDEEEENHEEMKEEETEDSKKMILPQRILDLQRELPTYLSSIQTAADAEESLRRKQQEEADRLRLEKLEDDTKTSQERFEEITRGWSTASQKATLWEVQEVLKIQGELCASLKEDKKRRISELQQEQKAGDDLFVRDLKKKAEVLGLMIERIDEQTKTLQKTFREELANAERVSQQESDVLLLKNKTEWDHHLKELRDKELEWLAQRQKEMGEKREGIEEKMLNSSDQSSAKRSEINEAFMVFKIGCQKTVLTDRLQQLETSKNEILEMPDFTLIEKQLKNSLHLEKEHRNLLLECVSQEKQFKKKSHQLSDRYKRNIQQNERTKEKIKHFASADEKQLKQMWPTIDKEVKQLVEMVLDLDSLIWRQHLGLVWQRPHAAFMEQTGPIQTQKQAQGLIQQEVSESFLTRQALQSGAMMDASVGPTLETDTEDLDKEEAAVQSEGGAVEEEEEDLSNETLKKIMELLYNETGFLLDEVLSLTEEQTVVKLGSLLSVVGIEEEDVPRFAHFLLKYKNQQKVQTEAVGAEMDGYSEKAEEVENHFPSHVTSNSVLPALRSFLEQHVKSRESSVHEDLSFQQEEVWDTSEDKAYWKSMGNILSEDREKVWDTAENKIEHYHEGLMENMGLITETESLEQQNVMLRMLLQQDLSSLFVGYQTAFDTL